MVRSSEIKRLAAEAGFDLCGIAPCRPMPRAAARFGAWLARGYHSSLGYMERHADKRFDPRLLVEGARTAVVCAIAYKNRVSEGYPRGAQCKVASYACAADYHTTLRRMLAALLDALRMRWPGLAGRAFVDTAPLAEKQLAVEAGLGWIGRQSLLITPQFGSFVVLGELLLDDEADAWDAPLQGAGCGSCRACVAQCPTGAIVADCTVDTGRCISCHTIEREPASEIGLDGWIFGCDACQSVCPWNRQAPHYRHPAFAPRFDPLEMGPGDWEALDEEHFRERMGDTPLVRSGLARIRRNIGR